MNNQTIYTTGGNLSIQQTTAGQLADFNMWDYEMSADEVNVTTCGPAGNVVSWDTLKKKGDAMESVKAFPGCNGESTAYVLHQRLNSSLKQF